VIDRHTQELCKKNVFRDWCYSRCSHGAWRDGYCKQHHPDVAAARKKKSNEKRDAEMAERKIKRRKLEAFDDLLKALEAVEWNKLTGRCPSCDWHMSEDHAPACQLNAALKKARGE
jgi:hypothetical protein